MQGPAAEGANTISDVLAALSNGPTGAPPSAEARIKLLERRMTGGASSRQCSNLPQMLRSRRSRRGRFAAASDWLSPGCAGGRMGAQLSPRNLQRGSFAKMPQREVTADSGQQNISGNHSRFS